MKDLIGVLALGILVSSILGLAFLFQGEPDVWDALRARAIAGAQCK